MNKEHVLVIAKMYFLLLYVIDFVGSFEQKIAHLLKRCTEMDGHHLDSCPGAEN